MDEPETSESDDGAPTAPFWMTTFSDMMTILMTFFVMIVSMSEVKVEKFESALSYFQGQPSVLTKNTSVIPSRFSAKPSNAQRLHQRDIRYQQFLEYLRENDLDEKVQVNRTETGVHIVIADSVMFRTGRARLIEPSRSILRMLAKVLDKNVNSVVVEGHTDDRPIRTSRFPSNWELSTARAASSVRFLQENTPELDPSRYAAVGYGSHHPRAPNETGAGRAQNRRVEILFDLRSWNDPTKPPTRPRPRTPTP